MHILNIKYLHIQTYVYKYIHIHIYTSICTACVQYTQYSRFFTTVFLSNFLKRYFYLLLAVRACRVRSFYIDEFTQIASTTINTTILRTYIRPDVILISLITLHHLLPIDEYGSHDSPITDNGPFWSQCFLLHPLFFLSIALLMFCERVLHMRSFGSHGLV